MNSALLRTCYGAVLSHASPAPVNPYFSGAAGTWCILQESMMDMQYKYETNTFLVAFRLHVCLAIPST